MWKLVTSKGNLEHDDPYVKSLNNNVGRQFWEFDSNLCSPEQLSQLEFFRQEFYNNRFQFKHSSDLLFRFQVAREHKYEILEKTNKMENVEEDMNIISSEEKVKRRLRRALKYYSTLQVEDGHWPADYGGPLSLIPALVIGLSLMGALHTVLSSEHQKEMRRYIFNHQWFPSFSAIAKSETEEAKKAAIEQVTEGLVLLEDAFAKCSKGKSFFGGDNIGYLDIALGCFLGWLRVNEKMNNLSLINETKTPGLHKWAQSFCSHAAVKDILPETEKLIEIAKFIFAKSKAPPSN